MNEQKLEIWRKNVDITFCSQIILDRLKKNKKINNEKYREISKKIKKIRYKNFLNSPHFEGKEELRFNALILCIKSNFPSFFHAQGFSFN